MFELWRKRRELDRVDKFYDAKIKKAQKDKKSYDEIEELKHGAMADTYFFEEEIKAIVSRSLIRKAEQLLLPVPSINEEDMWERGDLTGRWYLTPVGIAKLRGVI